MNLGTATVIRGDARALPLADASVDLVVTSPPYFALRSYQDGGVHYDGQIGSEPTPAEFLDALLEVTRECVRVLKPSGSLWLNLGDKYVSDNRGSGGDAKRGQAKYAPAGRMGYVGEGVMPRKSLMGIPWRYAIRCIDELGLILRAEVIWSKPNGLPESVTDRVRRSHEQFFHFTLQPRYFSAVDEIREPHKPGQSPSALSFAREGRETAPGQSCAPHRLGRADQGLNPLGKLPGSVWTDEAGLEASDSLVRSVLAATAAGALTIEEGEHILWTGSTAYGRRSTTATPATAGAGSAPTTDTATDATGRPTKATGVHTDSSTKCQSDQSRAGSPSTTSAATAGASTLPTSSRSPCERTSPDDPEQSAAPLDTPTTSRTHTSDATASASAADAWLSERGNIADAPPSVWVVSTEPLRVPDHLGIDHFAAFPTEWPRRIIQGWSPAGVCVECGEGRRPVTQREANGKERTGPQARRVVGYQPVDRSDWQEQVLRTITGYSCACPDSSAPTRPAVVLDVFGGTGTTAMVAKALGRHGITVDMSADYCRLAEWRTNDRDQLAKVLGVRKADGPTQDESLLDLLEATP